LHYFNAILKGEADSIAYSKQGLSAVLAQVNTNQADLKAAVAANQDAGTDTAVQNLNAVNRKFNPLEESNGSSC